ncbi:alkaline phosphatase family protein [Fulvivirga sp. RKSG066]|uniref:alkaline phosphatase D family protein n=1 Tax=Fulvivirga aurantia TaxID=2529383 RepID=UPI0012BCBC50|nr:alkaline phosphatase D family protein [Fulvivirga aurantia]MTI22025.1 alkaline phosphatase family protein [Fulvivirga aurantia]
MKISQLLPSITLFAILVSCQAQEQNSSTVIAFGSCSHQDNDDQMWSEITAEKPDLMIMAGDNIYGDTQDMSEMKEKYEKQKSRPGYQKLMKNTKIIGIWDDHDYGVNDGGKYYAKKDSSKNLMLDFLDVPQNDPVRDRRGAYSSYVLNDNDKSIKVILLDTRYFRDTLQRDEERRYLVNEDGDILGEEQWHWLESELSTSDANVNIIVSSIQVIAADHPYEKWANFPKSHNKLLYLIGQTSPSNTLIISGDRHIAELSSMEIDGLNYPLYDLTASGLTHTWRKSGEEENQYRIGDLIIAKNYGLITIDWSNEEILLEVKGTDRQELLSHSITLN